MRKLFFLITCLLTILFTYNSCDVCEINLADDTAPEINILLQEGDTAYVLEEDNLAFDNFDTPITLTMFGVDGQSGIHILNVAIDGTAECLDSLQTIDGTDPILTEYPLGDDGCSVSSRNIMYEIPTITSCPNPSPLEAVLVGLEWEFTINSTNHAGLQSERVLTITR